MSTYKTTLKRFLFAALFSLAWTTAGRAAEWPNYPPCGHCAPNVPTYGYIPTQWRRWPGTESQPTEAGARQDSFPPSRYELPKPLHEAEGSAPAAGPRIGSPMGPTTEPGTGLPNSTRPMEPGGSNRSMGTGTDQSKPGPLNPFKEPLLNPPNNESMPKPDSSNRPRAVPHEQLRPSLAGRVSPASATIAEPLPTAEAIRSKAGNPLRDQPLAGWHAIDHFDGGTDGFDEPSRTKRSNPLRED